jgi:energy-coupling factor transporter ATP-binding protein EcfA2
MALNPFIWDRPLDDPAKIVGMEPFAHEVALTLKGQTNVALFGPRDTGKTTFTQHRTSLPVPRSFVPPAVPVEAPSRSLARVRTSVAASALLSRNTRAISAGE